MLFIHLFILQKTIIYLIKNTIKTIILWNITLKIVVFYLVYLKNVIYLFDQSWIFIIITPIFSVPSEIILMLLKLLLNYYQLLFVNNY